MKRDIFLFLVLIFLAFVPVAGATALLDKGSSELGVSGWIDFATADGTDVALDLRYAYFLVDRVGFGGILHTRDSRHSKICSLGGIVEYNFTLPEEWRPAIGTDLVPYLAGSVQYAYSDIYDFSEDAFVFRGDVGVKFFLTDTSALTLGLVGSWATEDIYEDDDEATDLDLQMQLGMRLYF